MDLSLLRTPRWIAGTALALLAVLVFANLGLWQLRRHEERMAANATIAERLGLAPESLDNLVVETEADPARLQWNRVTVDGNYFAGADIILHGRSHKASAGSNLLTPLISDGGVVVIVNRGWIPLDATIAPGADAAPVTVTGILRPDEGSGLLSGGGGSRDSLKSIDLERIDASLGNAVLPVYLQLETQQPMAPGAPEVLPQPKLDQGPHRSYAVQWFLFAAIVAIGFPVLVYRTAKERVRTPERPSTSSSVP